MNKVYFANAEAIDLTAITTMGVSVKVKDNPIGYFGTGLKFAIATVLRTGHKVRLRTRDPATDIEFRPQPTTIRGEEFQLVRMCFNGGTSWQDLGFTTSLGRNWEVWQAYRELRCNVMDEEGVVSFTAPEEGTWGTLFEVEGDAFYNCHLNGKTVFLEGAALYSHPESEVYAGPSNVVYYRGVRVAALPQASVLTHNLTANCGLTEDRTLKNFWELDYHVSRSVAQCRDADLLEQLLLAPKGSFECGLTFSNADKPSPEFMRVVEHYRRMASLNSGALKLWLKHADAGLAYVESALSAHEEKLVQEALAMVKMLAPEARREDFTVLDGMGDVFGLFRGGRMYIARRTLDRGARFTASTMYEEWIHKTERAADGSRDFQDHVLDKLFMVVERLKTVEGS